MNTPVSYDTYSAMQADQPLAIFKKTIVGKVAITVLNPFSGAPEGIILVGDSEDSYVKLWDEKQLSFFERANRDHFKNGRLQRVEQAPVPQPSPNIISDEEIDELLNGHYKTLQSKVKTFTSEAPVHRILNRARELDKSEKLITWLEGVLAEMQFGE
jgi:hypothetical protein